MNDLQKLAQFVEDNNINMDNLTNTIVLIDILKNIQDINSKLGKLLGENTNNSEVVLSSSTSNTMSNSVVPVPHFQFQLPQVQPQVPQVPQVPQSPQHSTDEDMPELVDDETSEEEESDTYGSNIPTTQPGDRTVQVESMTDASTTYDINVTRATCTCKSFLYNYPSVCKHMDHLAKNYWKYGMSVAENNQFEALLDKLDGY